ncbi:MAG: hypothetical protein RLZZ387_5208 [Chloroflexota bacterium]|jgi:UDP-glucose 4-epimerase
MKVVVTGGAGFIGSHLVDRLMRDGVAEIIVLDNLHRGRHEHLAVHQGNLALRVIEGDIRDMEVLREHFAGATFIFHLAAQSNVMGAVNNISYSYETNVTGTFNVLQAAHEAGARRVVFASSREVYGEVDALPVSEDRPLNAKNAYGASKAAGELYCRVFQSTYGLEVAVLRLANVYGPRDTGRVIPLWLDAATSGRDLLVYGGAQVIDFIYVEQVVEALLRATTADVLGQPVNVGSGVGTPILELAEQILALSDGRSRVEHRPARSVEVAQFCADITQMRARLELEPPADPLFALPQLWEIYQRGER